MKPNPILESLATESREKIKTYGSYVKKLEEIVNAWDHVRLGEKNMTYNTKLLAVYQGKLEPTPDDLIMVKRLKAAIELGEKSVKELVKIARDMEQGKFPEDCYIYMEK